MRLGAAKTASESVKSPDDPATICRTLLRAGKLLWLIEIRPDRNGWKVFEAPGVEPVFPEKRQTINYAQNRASFRSGEIRILDSTGLG